VPVRSVVIEAGVVSCFVAVILTLLHALSRRIIHECTREGGRGRPPSWPSDGSNISPARLLCWAH